IMDEVRFSKVARYDKDFTPAKRFEPDADTLALYHFDEGAGDVLKDSSGNGHHGKIVGAKWVNADGSPIAPPAAAGYALSFEAKGDEAKNENVALPSLRVDYSRPFTLEAYAAPRAQGNLFQNLRGGGLSFWGTLQWNWNLVGSGDVRSNIELRE